MNGVLGFEREIQILCSALLPWISREREFVFESISSETNIGFKVESLRIMRREKA
jgi:hypothetical protein